MSDTNLSESTLPCLGQPSFFAGFSHISVLLSPWDRDWKVAPVSPLSASVVDEHTMHTQKLDFKGNIIHTCDLHSDLNVLELILFFYAFLAQYYLLLVVNPHTTGMKERKPTTRDNPQHRSD